MAPANRLDVLARRVGWLDRYRRPMSIVLAVACWVVMSRELAAFFGTRWPLIAIVTSLFGMVGWWVIEMVFAWVIALWETEHDRISRDRGLPRASLLRRRRKK